jgi:hypothetical protein
MKKLRPTWKAIRKLGLGALFVMMLANLPRNGGGCPHEGRDHRMLGESGCWIQRQLTVENAQTPAHIWSFAVAKLTLRIDPRHPHLLIEWPAGAEKLWRFRMGYRWDANARAYIFPAIAFKKVKGPMTEYLSPSRLATP